MNASDAIPTWDQVKGLIERAVLIATTFLVAKGYITNEMAALAAQFIIPAAGLFYAWWVNRPKAIVQSAAALPNTMVVTTPDLSNNTPETNIVSNITNKVVDTKTGAPTPSAQPITPPSDK